MISLPASSKSQAIVIQAIGELAHSVAYIQGLNGSGSSDACFERIIPALNTGAPCVHVTRSSSHPPSAGIDVERMARSARFVWHPTTFNGRQCITQAHKRTQGDPSPTWIGDHDQDVFNRGRARTRQTSTRQTVKQLHNTLTHSSTPAANLIFNATIDGRPRGVKVPDPCVYCVLPNPCSSARDSEIKNQDEKNDASDFSLTPANCPWGFEGLKACPPTVLTHGQKNPDPVSLASISASCNLSGIYYPLRIGICRTFRCARSESLVVLNESRSILAREAVELPKAFFFAP
ncbi:hypothetical protein SCHPADRAFT_932647 [Schizopora paradoxa]|uniref:Uncharacterized protein n=1 Tax=Schizopora paradoxa TaxID=27342 RepID=A0A0H2R5R1_9AGAM|nr:hypothetical protein SCHPADRAFT_932647 [Schizopora paradoxa]